MSRIDDRIRARLHMQIVLRGIAVLLICAGIAVGVLWLISPFVEMILWGHGHTGTIGGRLKNSSGVLALGMSLTAPGVLLLFATDWLSERWVPLRSPRVCPTCAYPRDDMSREKCPNCGESLFAPGATRDREVRQASGGPYEAET